MEEALDLQNAHNTNSSGTDKGFQEDVKSFRAVSSSPFSLFPGGAVQEGAALLYQEQSQQAHGQQRRVAARQGRDLLKDSPILGRLSWFSEFKDLPCPQLSGPPRMHTRDEMAAENSWKLPTQLEQNIWVFFFFLLI